MSSTNGKEGCACIAARIWRHNDVFWQMTTLLFCSMMSSWRQVCGL